MKIKSMSPRDFVPINNKYHLRPTHGDYTVNAHYITCNSCIVHVQRHDDCGGWGFLEFVIDNNEVVELGSSMDDHHSYIINTRTELTPVTFNTQEIPKRIVQTSEFSECHGFSSAAYQSVIHSNPEYDYVFFNAAQRRKFIKMNFGQNILHAYDLLVAGAYQADLFRYCYLYIHGGCYLDFKMIGRVPLREVVKPEDKFMVCLDYERSNSIDKSVGTSYLNSIILTIAGNPLLFEMINACTDNIINNKQRFINEASTGSCISILDITGPTLFYKVAGSKVSDENVAFKHIIKGNDESRYSNFQILDLSTKNVVFTKTHKNYSYPTHYGTLWGRGEIFYRNFQQLEGYKVFVYPHPYNDTFSFRIQNRRIYAYRAEGCWWLELKVKIVNDITSESELVVVGRNTSGFEKAADFNI